MHIYFLDVGQGDCSVIVTPSGELILVDCADPYVAERFIRDTGYDSLSAVVVSHLDDDHCGGMLTLLDHLLTDGCRIGTLYVGMDRSPARLQEGSKRRLLDQVIAWHRSGQIQALAEPLREGLPRIIQQGNNWQVSIVLPHYVDVLEAHLDWVGPPNRLAAVLRVDCAGHSVLIGSDAPLVAWEHLDREPGLLPADVFRIPHHGGSLEQGRPRWTRADLYNRVRARLTVCSVGSRNAYGHPFEEHLLTARRSGGSRLLCTQLNQQCHAQPSCLREQMLKAASAVFYPLRHRILPGDEHIARPEDETPCAGTILVTLDEVKGIQVHPPPGGWHDTLVDKMEAPLCRRTLTG